MRSRRPGGSAVVVAVVPLAIGILGCAERPGGNRDASASSAEACIPRLPEVPLAYSDAEAPLPGHFLASPEGSVQFSDNTPADNSITNAGATLGRVLFYDTRLSSTLSLACASCHRQEFGFADTARFSVNVHGVRGRRRTMALANARFNPDGRFFWDQRAATLEAQVLVPIRPEGELGMSLGDLEDRLQATAYYPPLFAAAFGSPRVTREGIAAALAQFVRSLVSARAPFDSVFTTGGRPEPSRLSGPAREGWRLFRERGCVNCHRSIAQFADQASNTGLDVADADSGAGGGRFKPPSLRNVAVRPPYMHDGRFGTLEEVVTFYERGVRANPGLDPRLRGPDGAPRRLELTGGESAALVSFLRALTDSAFLRDERFSSPFPGGC